LQRIFFCQFVFPKHISSASSTVINSTAADTSHYVCQLTHSMTITQIVMSFNLFSEGLEKMETFIYSINTLSE